MAETISNDGKKVKRVLIGNKDADINGKKSHVSYHKADDLNGNPLTIEEE